MSNQPTSGVFRDPAGNEMNLVSTSPEAFRVLVTRKLESGWSYCASSPAVKPLIDETRLALPPAYEEITIAPREAVTFSRYAATDPAAGAVPAFDTEDE